MSNTFGIISLIFGLIALCGGWLISLFINIPFLGWLWPGVAIVFGIIGIIKDDSHGMAIAGLVLGIVSLVCTLLLLPIIMLVLLGIGMGSIF